MQVLENSRFIFLIGGPGCGEKTIGKMFEKKGFTTVSMKQVLLNEIQSNPEGSVKIQEAMANNELVSLNTVVNLLKQHLLELSATTNQYCIHGFPKDIDQLNKFENEIGKTEMALYLKVSDQTMKMRSRGDGNRQSFDEAVMEKKIRLFREKQSKCLEYYIKMKKLCQIDAEVPIDLVSAYALKCLDKKHS